MKAINRSTESCWLAAGLLLSALLSACVTATPPAPINGNTSAARPAATSVSAGFQWDWDAAGDPQLKPVQVFNNDKKTWLQMRPSQVMPAVMVAGMPVPFDHEPPYLVVQGVPARIDLVAVSYRSVITKRNPHTGVPAPAPIRSENPERLKVIPADQIPKEITP